MAIQPLSVLIVEDNASMAANIFDYLEACGHEPDAAPDGQAGLNLLAERSYDAIVLDWMMPRMSGIAMLFKLRVELRSTIPVIVLTAKDRLEHKLEGFSAGADDYLVKPFALSELEARLRALVARRRPPADAEPAIEVGDLSYEPGTMTIRRASRVLRISPIRRRILMTLMQRSPQLVTREELESNIWGASPPVGDILRSHMHLLRKEVDGEAETRLVHTIAGIGYRLGIDPDA